MSMYRITALLPIQRGEFTLLPVGGAMHTIFFAKDDGIASIDGDEAIPELIALALRSHDPDEEAFMIDLVPDASHTIPDAPDAPDAPDDSATPDASSDPTPDDEPADATDDSVAPPPRASRSRRSST